MIESTLKAGDHVQIRCAGIIVTGQVKSAYDENVMDEKFRTIGKQAAGIEVIDENTGQYHYWKDVDGDGRGVVTKLEDNGERRVIFPRPDRTGATALESRLAKSVFRRYFHAEYGKTNWEMEDDAKQLGYILDLVKIWFVRGGLFHPIDYHAALIAAREMPWHDSKAYAEDIRSVYNNCIRGGQANL